MGCHHIASYLACYTYRAVSLLDRDSTVGIQWEFIFSFTRHRDVRKLCLESSGTRATIRSAVRIFSNFFCKYVYTPEELSSPENNSAAGGVHA